MHTHVDLVGLLLRVAGALGLLLGASLLILGAGAASIAVSQHDREMAASLLSLVLVVVALLVLAWGVASLWTGGALRQHRPAARLAALAMAVLNVFILPFGTALAMYTLWVLLHEQARALFEPPARAS
jgi:hypothetical protein